MILITFGTERFKFNRLCKYIEKYASSGDLDDEIVVQCGYTPCDIKNTKVKIVDFFPYSEFKGMLQKASTIVIHAGVGSFLDVVSLNKVPIIVPRDPKLKEHVDDQQLQLAKVLKEEYGAPIVYNYSQFKNFLDLGASNKLKLKFHRKELVNFLDNWVNS